MYPFSYEALRITHTQMVEEALERGRIHAELKNKRPDHRVRQSLLRLFRGLSFKHRLQSECVTFD